MPKAIRLHLLSADTLHRKGDVLGSTAPVRVGQTPECDLWLVPHPDYADSCYAVIVPDGDAWCILRQEQDADITLNGLPLGMAAPLRDGDRLCFDRTEVRISFASDAVESGPVYVQQHRRTSPLLWGSLVVLFLLVAGILGFLYEQSKDIPHVFREEMASIYAVRTDSLIIEREGVRIAALPATPTRIGTGFVTTDGCFVTARHCIEYWLADEALVQNDTSAIASEAVRWALRAELDSTLTLRSIVSILDSDERIVGHFSSDAFRMDKSRDHLYERGDANTVFFWRSLISRHSRRDAELGDVAVLRWTGAPGNIQLGESLPESGADLVLFGYPADEVAGQPPLSFSKTTMLYVLSPGWFLAEKEADAGYSGGPVFVRNGRSKTVVGIVSRSSGGHTLVIPVSEIKSLL